MNLLFALLLPAFGGPSKAAADSSCPPARPAPADGPDTAPLALDVPSGHLRTAVFALG